MIPSRPRTYKLLFLWNPRKVTKNRISVNPTLTLCLKEMENVKSLIRALIGPHRAIFFHDKSLGAAGPWRHFRLLEVLVAATEILKTGDTKEFPYPAGIGRPYKV